MDLCKEFLSDYVNKVKYKRRKKILGKDLKKDLKTGSFLIYVNKRVMELKKEEEDHLNK